MLWSKSITLIINYKYTACQTQSPKHWVGLDPNGKAAGRAGFLEWFIKQRVMKTDNQGVSPPQQKQTNPPNPKSKNTKEHKEKAGTSHTGNTQQADKDKHLGFYI